MILSVGFLHSDIFANIVLSVVGFFSGYGVRVFVERRRLRRIYV